MNIHHKIARRFSDSKDSNWLNLRIQFFQQPFDPFLI